jgi:hypothetical protein
VIDPQGVIQIAEINAGGIGRDALELLRKVKAAQYVASHPGEVCPAKWKEGDATLKPCPDLVGKICLPSEDRPVQGPVLFTALRKCAGLLCGLCFLYPVIVPTRIQQKEFDHVRYQPQTTTQRLLAVHRQSHRDQRVRQ